MKILSVNIGRPREMAGPSGEPVMTGIGKSPVAGRVRAGRMGLEGDGQADRRHHGGEDKALYVYPHEHYAHWAAALGRAERSADGIGPRADFTLGQFGENLTIEGLVESDVRIGDRFRIGDAGVGGPLVEVTQPRVPCFKLGLRLGDAAFVKMFHTSGGRVGFYLRVLEPGEIGAGDAIVRIESDAGAAGGPAPTITEIYALMFSGAGDAAWAAAARLAAATPALSVVWRKEFMIKISQLVSKDESS